MSLRQQATKTRKLKRLALPQPPPLSSEKDSQAVAAWWADVQRLLGQQSDELNQLITDLTPTS